MIALFRLISLPHFARTPGRTLLIVLGIMLGVSARVATTTVNASILRSFDAMVSRVSGDVDLVITGGGAGLPGEVLDEVSALDVVGSASPSFETVSTTPGVTGPVLVLGIDVLRDRSSLSLSTERGEDVVEDPVEFLNDPRAVLLPRSFAARLGVEVGGKLELRTPAGPESFRVHGILADDGLASTFGGQLAVMYLDAAQLAFGRGDRLDRIELSLKPSADREAARREVAAVVAGRGQVDTEASRAGALHKMLVPLERGLEMGGLIALLVGMFLIYNTVGVTVAERRREIGVLRAFGVTRAETIRLFTLEAGFLAAIGGALGIAISGPLASAALLETTPTVSRFYAPMATPGAAVGALDAAVGFLFGVVSALLAAYLPARAAAAVDPVESLRPAEGKAEASAPRRWLFGAGLALLAGGTALGYLVRDPIVTNLAMVIIALGGVMTSPTVILGLRHLALWLGRDRLAISARLALDNAERTLGRSAITVSALMTAISASLSLAAWGHSLERSAFDWLDQALPADLYVTAGSPVLDQHNVPFDPRVLERLAGTPGVRRAMPARMLEVQLGDERISLLELDARIYFEELARKGMRPTVLDGPDPIDAEALAGRKAMVVAENAARRLGLRAGDSVSITTPTGTHALEVLATVVDYSSDLGFAYMHHTTFDALFDDRLIDTIDVFLEPGADPAATAAEIRRRLGDDSTLFVISAAELRQEIEKVLRDFLKIFASSELIALSVAILGVLGTMLASVLDRVREIGILRAIGATRRQVVRSIAEESAFLGLAAVVGGIVIGLPSGAVFVEVLGTLSTGWRVPYLFPALALARIGALVIVIAGLVGLVAGRRATALEVHEALGYE